jgi:hypothetical protein
MSREEDRPLLTRKGISELARSQFGIPLPKSRIEKDCIAEKGPKVAATYGHVHLYDEDEARRYIRNLIKPALHPAEGAAS